MGWDRIGSGGAVLGFYFFLFHLSFSNQVVVYLLWYFVSSRLFLGCLSMSSSSLILVLVLCTYWTDINALVDSFVVLFRTCTSLRGVGFGLYG